MNSRQHLQYAHINPGSFLKHFSPPTSIKMLRLILPCSKAFFERQCLEGRKLSRNDKVQTKKLCLEGRKFSRNVKVQAKRQCLEVRKFSKNVKVQAKNSVLKVGSVSGKSNYRQIKNLPPK